MQINTYELCRMKEAMRDNETRGEGKTGMWDYCIRCGGWERDPSCSARWHLSRDFIRKLKKATCHPYILFSVTRVPSSGSGPPAHPQECPEVGQVPTYPRLHGGTLQISPSLQASLPPPALPFPSISPSLLPSPLPGPVYFQSL